MGVKVLGLIRDPFWGSLQPGSKYLGVYIGFLLFMETKIGIIQRLYEGEEGNRKEHGNQLLC